MIRHGVVAAGAAGAWRLRWAWRGTGQPPRPLPARPLPGQPRPYQPVPAWITQLAGFLDDRTGRPRALVTSYAGARVVLDLLDGQLVGALDERAHVTVCTLARIGGARMIVSGVGAGHLQISDLDTGRSRWRRWCGDVRSLATAALGGRPLAVLAGGSPELQIWSLSLDRGERLSTLRIDGGRIAVLAAAEAGDTVLLAAGTSAGRVLLWRLTARPGSQGGLRAEPLGGYTVEVPGLVGALAFADWRGRPILLGAAGPLVQAWDVDGGHPLGPAFTGHAGEVNSVTAGRLGDRPVLFSADDCTVRAWLPETGEQVGEPFGYPYEAALTRTVALETSGRPTLVSGDGAGVVWVWDPERPYPFRYGAPARRPGRAGPAPDPQRPVRVGVTEFAGRPVGVVGFADRAVRAFDLADGAEVELRLDDLQGAAVLVPGDPPLLAGSAGERIELWDPVTGDPLGAAVPWPDGGPGPLASGLVAGRPALLLAAGTDLYLVDIATGDRAGPLTGHSGRITALALTELDGAPVALSAAQDDTVRLWDLRSGREIRTVRDGHGGAAYAVTTAVLDGRRFAVSAGQNGQVWGVDLTSAGPVDPWLMLHAGGAVRSLAVARDGAASWLVVADGATLLWRPVDPATGPFRAMDLGGAVTDLVAVPGTVLVAADDGVLALRPPAPG